MNKQFLRENIVEVHFITSKIMFLQPRQLVDDLQRKTSELNLFFYTLAMQDVILEEHKQKFISYKLSLLNSVMEIEHESHDVPNMEDTWGLELEIEKRKYFTETNQTLREEWEKSEEGIKYNIAMDSILNAISEEEFFKNEQ